MSIRDLMDGMLATVQGTLGDGAGVTLRIRTVGALNTTTGKLARTPGDYTLTPACRTRLEQRKNSNGVMVEERSYTFALADLAHGVYPVATDHVIDEGVTRPIVRVEAGADGRAVICHTSREAKGT